MMSDTSELYRLLYTSEARFTGTTDEISAEIDAIVATAVENNSKRGLGGILLVVQGTFIQVLEGASQDVEVTFEAICSDLRHGNLRVIEMVRAEKRLFPEWSMAYVGMSDKPSHMRINRDLREISVTVDGNPAAALRQMQALLQPA